MNARIETLERLKRKIENAYHDSFIKNQKDYPPYALTSWDDRARYHQFIMKLIQEEIDYENIGE